jgi:hypothetical protein
VVIRSFINTKNVVNGDYVRLRGQDKISVKVGFKATYEGDTNNIPE